MVSNERDVRNRSAKAQTFGRAIYSKVDQLDLSSGSILFGLRQSLGKPAGPRAIGANQTAGSGLTIEMKYHKAPTETLEGGSY